MTRSGQAIASALLTGSISGLGKAVSLSAQDTTTMIQDVFPHAVTMHPDDAAARGIKDGADVYVYTEAGCIKLPAKVTVRQLPGVVSIGEGAWYQPSQTEFFDAYFDAAGTGKAVCHRVPVDVGGAVNTLTIDRDIGASDPYLHLQTSKSGGFAAGGCVCEVSATLPA